MTDATQEVDLRAEVLKVDDSLGLVMGYAIICKEAGEPYYDLQGDYITEEAMLKAALDFMEHSQVAKEMHTGDQTGTVVFAWPMTTDIAKAFGLEVTKTGLLIAVRPEPEMLAKFRDGTYTGFSIGGQWLQEES